jgi:hypothetical protein
MQAVLQGTLSRVKMFLHVFAVFIATFYSTETSILCGEPWKSGQSTFVPIHQHKNDGENRLICEEGVTRKMQNRKPQTPHDPPQDEANRNLRAVSHPQLQH